MSTDVYVEPDWLQLHGSESAEHVAAVRATWGRRVIKVLPIETSAARATSWIVLPRYPHRSI